MDRRAALALCVLLCVCPLPAVGKKDKDKDKDKEKDKDSYHYKAGLTRGSEVVYPLIEGQENAIAIPYPNLRQFGLTISAQTDIDEDIDFDYGFKKGDDDDVDEDDWITRGSSPGLNMAPWSDSRYTLGDMLGSGKTMRFWICPRRAKKKAKEAKCEVGAMYSITVTFSYDCKDFMGDPFQMLSPNNTVQSPSRDPPRPTVDWTISWADTRSANEAECPCRQYVVMLSGADNDRPSYGDRGLQAWTAPCSSRPCSSGLNCAQYTVSLAPNTPQNPRWWYSVAEVADSGSVLQARGYATVCVETPPGAPAGLRSAQGPEGNVALRWDEPAAWGFACGKDPTRLYDVEVYPPGMPLWSYSTASWNVASAEVPASALLDGTVRWRVSAKKGLWSPMSSFAYCTDKGPTTPKSLVASSTTADSPPRVVLSWAGQGWGFVCPSTTPTGTYAVSITGVVPGSAPVSLSYTTPSPTVTTEPLRAGQYSWSVTATSSAGRSITTPLSSFTVCVNQRPAAPSVSFRGSPVSRVVWQRPDMGTVCPGSGAATVGYRVWLRAPGHAPREAAADAEELALDGLGLDAGSYDVAVGVAAHNGYQLGDVANASFRYCVPTAPLRPTLSSPSFFVTGSEGNSVRWAVDMREPCVQAPERHYVFWGAQRPPPLLLTQASREMPLPRGTTAGTYYFSVISFNGYDNSTSSDVYEITLTEPNVTFAWRVADWGETCARPASAARAAAPRRVRVSLSDPAGGDPETVCDVDQGASPAGACIAPLEPGEWLWRVAASNGAAESAESGSLRYRAVCRPRAPSVAPAAPADGATLYSSSAALAWARASCGQSCDNSTRCALRLVVDGRLAREAPLAGDAGDAGEWAVAGLRAGRHTWSVEVRNGPLNYTAEAREFSVCLPSVPRAPRLVAPANHSVVVLPAALAWGDPDWGTHCGLQRSLEVYVDRERTFTLPAGERGATAAALQEGARRWWVTARLGDAVASADSGVGAFVVCTPAAPEPPAVRAPASGAGLSQPIVLAWALGDRGANCSRGPERTVVSVWSAAGSAAPYALNATLAAAEQSLVLPELPAGRYSWRVAFYNGYAGLSAQTIVSAFRACVAPPPARLLAPADGAAYVSRVADAPVPVEFAWSLDLSATCGANVTALLLVEGPAGYALAAELPVSQQSYTAAGLPRTGDYAWTVAIASERWVVRQQQRRTVRVCVPRSPGRPALVGPPEGAVVERRAAVLRWAQEMGSSCAAQGNESAAGVYSVLVRPPGSSDYEVAAVLGDGVKEFTAAELLLGDYSWRVTYTRGFLTLESAVGTFKHCNTEPPVSPQLDRPSWTHYSYDLSNFTFSGLSSVSLGQSCYNRSEAHYEARSSSPSCLLVGRSGETLVSRANMSVVRATAVGGPRFAGVSLARGQWFWTIRVHNADQRTAAPTELRPVYACAHPETPALLWPPDGAANVSARGLSLRWQRVREWGECLLSRSKGYRLTVSYALLPAGADPALAANATETALLSGLADAFDFVGATALGPNGTATAAGDLANRTVVWRVALSNGQEEAESPAWSFATSPDSCATLRCGSGRCNPRTLMCVCGSAESELPCPPARGGGGRGPNVAAIVVPAVIGALLLLAAAGALLFLAAARRRRGGRRVTLRSPSERLRFFDVRMPRPTPRGELGDVERAVVEDCGRGFAAAVAMARRTGPAEADELSKALVYAYERHGAGLALLEALIAAEAEACERADVIFRVNSVATKAFKVYSKLVSLRYLYRTFGALLQELLQREADAQQDAEEEEEQLRRGKMVSVRMFAEGQHEVDPEKIEADDVAGLAVNVLQLCVTVQQFLTQILRSAPDIPEQITHVCWAVRSAVERRFPGEPKVVWAAVSAFVFLRLLNVAITVPESYGLLQRPPEPKLRRTLVLVSKVLQTAATGTLFGSKESYMTSFNELIANNTQQLAAFYDRISAPPQTTAGNGGRGSSAVRIPDEYYEPSLWCILAESQSHGNSNNSNGSGSGSAGDGQSAADPPVPRV
eukprot:m51a1_g11603 hypothetical protein (2010) ;mRNA; f:137542-149676